MALNARPSDPFEVKALAFDVFGTVVDWRGSIIREGAEWGRAKGLELDWAEFADRWRAGYGPSMDKVGRGTLPWMNLDALHRIILDDLLDKFGVTGLTEAEKDHWNRVWHRLTPWPDAVEGLARLKERTCWPRSRTVTFLYWRIWRNPPACRGMSCCRRSYSIITSRIARFIWAQRIFSDASRRNSSWWRHTPATCRRPRRAVWIRPSCRARWSTVRRAKQMRRLAKQSTDST